MSPRPWTSIVCFVQLKSLVTSSLSLCNDYEQTDPNYQKQESYWQGTFLTLMGVIVILFVVLTLLEKNNNNNNQTIIPLN